MVAISANYATKDSSESKTISAVKDVPNADKAQLAPSASGSSVQNATETSEVNPAMTTIAKRRQTTKATYLQSVIESNDVQSGWATENVEPS